MPQSGESSTGWQSIRLEGATIGDTTALASLTGLNGQNVFLVKANVGDYLAEAGSTGSVLSSSRPVGDPALARLKAGVAVGSGRFRAAGMPRPARRDCEAAQRFNARPPVPRGRTPGSRSAIGAATTALSGAARAASIGDAKQFWVATITYDDQGNETVAYSQKWAHLHALGDHCAIWVLDENYLNSSTSVSDNRVNTATCNALRDTFEEMHAHMVNLFGYEYGGDPALTDGTAGGKDGDLLVQILIYNINGTVAPVPDGTYGIMGMFWGKDYYDEGDSALGSDHSNEAEIIYFDSYFIERLPEEGKSALAHEYQHMINFNRKAVAASEPNGEIPWVDTWYNEMLSLLAEEIVGGTINLPAEGLPLATRIPLFLGQGFSMVGVTEWFYDDLNPYCYSMAYAFGAYLVRNYGGATLVEAIMDNGSFGKESVGAALMACNPSVFPSGTFGPETAFDEAFRRFGEALVFSGEAADASDFNTFDRTTSAVVSGQSYLCSAFDVWSIKNYFSGWQTGSGYVIPTWYDGPLVIDFADIDLPAHGLSLESAASWLGVYGDLSVEVALPTDPDVELYLMVR